jgi:uncharacterized membrane protein YphA (DoxX/SURF4 family)
MAESTGKLSKGKNIALWVISAVMALMFAGSGIGKMTQNPEMVANFAKWGHGPGFLIFIGAAEAAGGVGLLIPPLCTLAATGLIVIMGGAVFTHLTNNDLSHAPIPMVIVILLAVVGYARRPRWLGGR